MAYVTVPADALADAADIVTVTATSQGDIAQSAGALLTTTADAVYGVLLEPETAAQVADAGETAIYTLRVTNTGNTTDTFDIASAANVWDTQLPVTSTELAAGVSVDLIVTVTVPAGVTSGISDTVTITATSQGNPEQSDSAILTTTVGVYEIYLPLVFKH